MSVWWTEPTTVYPRLSHNRSADVVVIGAGIAGVAAALFLARARASVVVLEARMVAAGASGRNAGFLLAGVAENFLAASRRYGERTAERVWRFTRRNQDLVRSLVTEHAIACDLAWNGSLQLAADDQEWNELAESAARLNALGFAARSDAAARTVCHAGDGEVNPVRLVRGLAAGAVTAGAAIHEDTRVSAIDGGVVRADGADVRADAVVICTNAWASHLLPNGRASVRAIRGQMLATAPAAARVFDRPTYAQRGFRYWRQTPDGRVLVGGWRDLAPDTEVGEDERTTERIQGALEGFLREHGIGADVTHRWAGIMGFSRDGLPYVGRVGKGVYVCAGFTGHGLGQALAAAQLVATLVRGGPHPDAEVFDPERP